MYGRILQNIVLPCGDWMTGHSVIQKLNAFRDMQYWTLQQHQKFQEKRLRTLLDAAVGKTPFYRELYAGLEVRDIGLQNLDQLPVVSKKALKAAYPEACVIADQGPTVELFTSGSSGQPFAVRMDRDSMSEARALMFLRAMFSGWTIGQPYLQTGMSIERGFLRRLKDLLLRVEYESAYDLSSEALESHVRRIVGKELRFVMGYPASVYYLARAFLDVGAKWKLRGVVTWGDRLYDYQRTLIEDVFSVRVTDTYGCGEGIQIAAQCEQGRYHVFMPHVLVESIDEDGVPVEDGEIGRLVLTRLTAGAMPFIRYEVGDLGALAVTTDCACGREGVVLTSLNGRESDVVHVPNGNRLIVHFFTGIFEYYPAISQFKVTQQKIDEIEIDVIWDSTPDADVLRELEALIVDKAGYPLRVKFRSVDEIPVAITGKVKLVESDIAKRCL